MADIKCFNDLNLNNWILKQCESIGVTKPTPIQANCIPAIMKGNDCIGCARTGSGKTLAFALPILQKLCEDPYGIFALVLTPTRELAFQIADQFAVIGKVIGLRHSVIVGGMDMVKQGLELSRKPHIVVATPGRLADHLGSCDTFSLRKIKFLVLDEADRLLSGDYDDQIKTIFSALPKTRQTLLFSATMNDTLERVQKVTGNKAFFFEASGPVSTVEQLKQYYVLCPSNVRDGYLVEVIRQFQGKHPYISILVFTDTCKSSQLLSMSLNDVGFDNVVLHSMESQKLRLAALTKFRSNVVKILVATDLASRGLDIPAVGLVINHIIPNKSTDYIHRVGRTARAGRGGTAISLLTPEDRNILHSIEDDIGTKLEEFPVDAKEVSKIFTQVCVSKREAEIKLDKMDFGEKREINKRKKLIMQGKDPDKEQALKLARQERARKRMKRLHYKNKKKYISNETETQ